MQIYINWNFWIKYICVYISIYIYIREQNGKPLQYSCLENPVDGA